MTERYCRRLAPPKPKLTRDWSKADRATLEALADWADQFTYERKAPPCCLVQLRQQCPAIRTRAEVDAEIVRVIRERFGVFERRLNMSDELQRLCAEVTR
jgi:hypothetical protein